MVSVISRFITKTLCDNQGCMDFKLLDKTMSQFFTVAEPILHGVLFDDSIIAIQEGREKAVAGKRIQPDSLMVAKTSLRICQEKMCLHCDRLHLCKFFVCGGCTFGVKCKNPHSLDSAHNAELLKRYDLQCLTEKQLFQLLLQNDPYLLPEICPHYNKGDGVHGSCKFTTSCTKLHVCQHYLRGDCKFGALCKRTHRIDGQGQKIFQGFSQENIENHIKTYRNKLIIMEQQEMRPTAVSVPPTQYSPNCNPGLASSSACLSKPMGDADRDEICPTSFANTAASKKCAHVHWRLPYRWQVLDQDGVTWKDLPNMEDIEKAYCDPERDTDCTGQPSPTNQILELLSFQSCPASFGPSVNFMTMTSGKSPVRRLSTVSSVSKPPHFILTTEWCWYWKDDHGKWQEFGQSNSDTQASVTPETLENIYLADRDTKINVGTGNQQYIVHFKSSPMYRQNANSRCKREIRRRPRFVSAQDVELMLKSSSSSTAESFPSHWDKNALPDIGYKLVPLSTSAKEYDMIETLFKRTMPLSRINNIQRIQNPSLWEGFQWQGEQMRKRNGGNAVNQQYLFHGSDKSEAICEDNFDWRICGTHGTTFGKGSYFARDASCSDKYSRLNRGQTKIMFVALVLVGEFTRGREQYVRPPPKGDGKTFYDSCVDCESDPSIYVVFEKQQIYPAYLINYS